MLYRPTTSRSSLGIRIFLAGLILIVSYQLYTLAFQIYKDSQIDIQYRSILEENARLTKERDQLVQLIAYLQTPGYREKEQKNIANLVKPGEKLLLLERPPASATPSGTPDESAATVTGADSTKSIPQKWWDYLFGEDELLTRPIDRDLASPVAGE